MAVVVLTSSGMGEAAVTALRSGANDFIVKRGDYLQRLPAVMRNAIARQAAEQVKRASPLKILYETRSILDLEQMLRHFARFAPHIHFEVVQSALEAVSKHTSQETTAEGACCDVLLLDNHLGETNAVEFLKIFQEKLRVPVVVATDQSDEEIAVQALRLGAADYVVKDASYLRRLPTVLENAHFRAQYSREKAMLAASMQTMRAIVDSSPIAIISIDIQGRVQSWNPAATHMFGWTQVETLGGPIPFLPSEKAGDFQGFLSRTLTGEPMINIESRRARRDGAPIDVSISTAPLRDSMGKIAGAIWMISDITGRRHDEQKIAEQARLLDFALDAILVRGTDEHLVFCNEAAVKLYGYTREELQGLPPDDTGFASRLLLRKQPRHGNEALTALILACEDETQSPMAICLPPYIVSARQTRTSPHADRRTSALIANAMMFLSESARQQLERVRPLVARKAGDDHRILRGSIARAASALPISAVSQPNWSRIAVTGLFAASLFPQINMVGLPAANSGSHPWMPRPPS